MEKNYTPKSIIENYVSPIFNEIEVGIGLVDSGGTVRWANKIMKTWFGPLDTLDHPPCALLCQQDKANCCVEQAKITGQKTNTYIKNTNGHGLTRHFELTTYPIENPPSEKYSFILIARETTSLRAEKIQDTIYQIASAAGSANKLEAIYPTIHEIIKDIMPAPNFYIALLEQEKNAISFPYFVDEQDPPPTTSLPLDQKSITGYVLRTAQSLLCTQDISIKLDQQGEVDIVGTEPAVWLGAPLIIEGETIGVIAMQHYQDPEAYTPKDQRILEFVSTEVAKAIQNKHTEKALQESEKRFRNIVETLPLGMHLYRLMPNGDLVFIAANRSADQILGVDCSQYIGKKVEEAFPTLKDSEISAAYRNIAVNGGVWQHRQITKEHERPQAGVDISAFQTSPNEVAVLFEDISEKLHTELVLIESEKRFRSVVEGSPMGIFIYHLTDNGELIFMESNPAADEILGVDCQQFIGKTIEEAFPPLADTEVPGIYRKIAANGGVWQTTSIEYQDEKISGAYEVFAFQISPMRVAIHYQDVTNRKKTEDEITRLNEELEARVAQRTAELEAATREMEAFAYSVSHDLRAPVRSVKGFSELIIQSMPAMPADEIQELLERIYQSSIKMDHLIDDLLSLSYLENQELEIQKINLSEMVANITDQLSKAYQDTSFKFNIQDTPDTRADKDMIHIMLTNLISNALKFTAENSQPEITFGSQDHQLGTTYFLKDNGIGFEMQYAEKIFAPFERLHTTEYEGTGIGLAIVRRVIQRHKGRIWVSSELGQGTTFFFSFGTQQAIT